ncbi:MAG TPA: hypothetical protein VF798_07580, partial [Burkholderiaceae bacterium]
DATGGTRYVWVNNLTLRAAPDIKAEALACLPLGASVQVLAGAEPLVHREESLPGLKLDKQVNGKPLKIGGDWRHVRAGTAEGWVFDGYLSRYPYPKDSKGSDKIAMEFAAAKQAFGARMEKQWMTGDATNGEIFRAMPQHLQDEAGSKERSEISWDSVSFAAGGQGELAIDTRDSAEGWSVKLDKLPMTYQEALLWAKRWGWMGDYGAVLDDGRTKLRFDFDETKADMEYTIACEAQTCSIQYSYATE